MFKFLRHKSKQIHALFTIFLLLFQNFIPLFALAPTAQAQTNVNSVSLAFDSESNQLTLSGEAAEAVEYFITYDDENDETPADAITGLAQIENNKFSADLFVGTCSTDENCVKDEITKGTLSFENTDYEASFEIKNDQLWLKEGSIFKTANVEVGTTYVAPQNDQVTVTFTTLPENSGSLMIEEITLNEEQVAALGATSNIAYDITSDMENGSFAYDLTLPVPENIEGETKLVYAESVAELAQAQTVENEIVIGDQITAEGLDHFTVFVVTNVDNSGSCSGASITTLGGDSCYTSLQSAINAASAGDTIELHRDLVTSSQTNINKQLTIDGNGHILAANFSNNATNKAVIGITGTNNITLKNIVVDGLNGTSLHGINIYTSTGILLDAVTSKNNDKSGIVVNGSQVTINNIITESNNWHGINADLGSGVTQPAVLTINGVSSHSETLHVYLDDVTKNVSVIDNNNQYNFAHINNNGNHPNDRVYNLKAVITDSATGITSANATLNGTNKAYNASGHSFWVSTAPFDVSNPNTIPSGVASTPDYGPIAANTSFSAPLSVVTTNGIPSNLASITPNTTYYFVAWSLVNGSWQHGETLSFTTSPAPTTPTLLLPSNNSTVTGNPTQSWSSATGAHHYIYQSFSDEDLSNLVYETQVNGTQRTVGGNQTVTFWWRVKAVDAVGNESAWSPAWKLTVDNTAPTKPTGLKRLGSDNNLYQCSDFSLRQNMKPMWDANSELDFSHYEYSSFNANGSQGLNESVLNINEFSNTWVAPEDGTYGFAVRAVDLAGNKSAWALTNETLAGSCQITYDSIAPTTTLTSPINGIITKSGINITGTSDDENSVEFVKIYFSEAGQNNWQEVTVLENTGATPFDFNYSWIPSQNGTYDIKVAGTDSVGNIEQSAYALGIIYDTISPDVEVTAPTNDFIAGNVEIRGSVTDVNPHHYWFVIQNSANQTVAGSGTVNDSTSFTNKLLLNWNTTAVPNGVYKIKLEARDAANNKDSGSSHWKTVTVDNAAPTSTITNYNLANGGSIETNEFTGLIEGTASDALSGINHVLLSISHLNFGADESETKYWDATNSAWVNTESMFMATGTESWNYQLSDVPNGIYNIASHAVDNVGNVESTYRIRIVYDKTIPEVILTINPATPDGENGWYRYTNPTITLTASDNYNLDHIEYQWNSTGGSWTIYTSPFNPPSEGQNILYYRAIDSVGNISAEPGIKEVKFDKTNPAGEPLEVKVENITSNTANATWKKPTDDSDVSHYRLSWRHENGTEYSAETGKDDFAHQLDKLFNGLWTLSVKAVDSAGNFTEKKVDFRVGPGPSAGGTSTEGSVLGTTTGFGTGGTAPFITQTTAEEDEETAANTQGTTTQSNPTEGAVLGTSTCNGVESYLPIILLVAQLLVLLAVEVLNREAGFGKFVASIAITIAVIPLYFLLRNTECFAQGTGLDVVNNWFAGIALITGIAAKLIGKAVFEEK